MHGADAEVLGEAANFGGPSVCRSSLSRWKLRFVSKPLTAMLKLRHLSQRRQYVCRQCLRNQHTLARGERPSQKWAGQNADEAARQTEWEDHASRIKGGSQQSMLSLLEERGFVKDVAG